MIDEICPLPILFVCNYIGAASTSRAKSLMSLDKNLYIKAVRRSSRSLSVIDRNIDFDVVPWPSNMTRPKIVAVRNGSYAVSMKD